MTTVPHTKSLRIAYLVQQFPPEVGAGPARVGEMALRWKEHGATVTVVTCFPSRVIPGRTFGHGDPTYAGKVFTEESWNGIRVLRSWAYGARASGFLPTITNNVSFMLTSAANALASLGDVDVLIASSPPFFPHISGRFIASMRGVPLVLEVRDLWPDYLVDMGVLPRGGLGSRALFALERTLLRSAQATVVVTESFRHRILEKGVSPDRIHLMPNGVDSSLYFRETGAAVPLPALEHPEGVFLVGYLGNFGAGQGLGVMRDVADILAKQDPTIRLVLAGDGPERAAVHAKIQPAGLPNIALAPPIEKNLTRAFYNSCDACLVPLANVPVFQETLPSKIFEIMACERPVIACLSGEGQRVIESSGGGVVASPGDAASIAGAILALRRTTPDVRAAMGRRGRHFAITRYDRHAIADDYYRLLQSIVAA